MTAAAELETVKTEVAGMEKKEECKPCPEGQVRKDGKCVMPEVTFTTFVISLNTTTLYHLGEISDPLNGEKKQDLVLAKHSIDTLKLLEDKTKGNLTAEEQDLLKHVLYDLKMRYVAKAASNK
jgi:hypothetical protein